MTTTPSVPALPDTPLARSLITTVTSALSRPLADHSIRSYLFARLLADHLDAAPGRDYDQHLLFAACVLHDMGLSDAGDGDQRFEVDGADLAARLLTDHGLPAADVDAVWEAIALHTSPGIAERRGLLCHLTRAGVGMDFGRGAEPVGDELGAQIHARHPRQAMETVLVEAITSQAVRNPSKAPRYSIADVFLLERADPLHLTRMEQGARRRAGDRDLARGSSVPDPRRADVVLAAETGAGRQSFPDGQARAPTASPRNLKVFRDDLRATPSYLVFASSLSTLQEPAMSQSVGPPTAQERQSSAVEAVSAAQQNAPKTLDALHTDHGDASIADTVVAEIAGTDLR